MLTLAQLQARQTALEIDRADLRRQLAEREATVLVDQLVCEGLAIHDRAAEVRRMADLSQYQRQERAEEIRTNYARCDFTEADLEVAQRYMRLGMTWEQARSRVLLTGR
jgi:hypothetical protein